jgi:hypothetical protein
VIRHDVIENELGAYFALQMSDGVSYLIDLAKKAPGEIHLFEFPAALFGSGVTDTSDCVRKISVALAISDEARADLERRLSGFPWTRPEPEAKN